MQIRSCSTLIMTAVLFIGTAWGAIITDQDRHANFSNYKTYSWGRLETANSMWDQRVKNAIDKQFAAKGLSQVKSGGDVVVNAIEITRVGQDAHVPAADWGAPGWAPGGSGAGFADATGTKGTYALGTLVVEISDRSSKTLVRWNLSDNALSSRSEKPAKKLDNDVKKMFKHFPPASPSSMNGIPCAPDQLKDLTMRQTL